MIFPFRLIDAVWLGVMASGPVLLMLAAVFEMKSEPWKQRPVASRVFYSTGILFVYIGLLAGIVLVWMLFKGVFITQ